MSIESDPVPPVPQHTPPIDKRSAALERFENNWMQWFIALRNKINIINALVVNFSKLVGTGFPSLTGTIWNLRSMSGPDSVKITNGDGVSGDPTFRLENDDSTLTPLTAYGKDANGVRGWFRPALFESTGVLLAGGLSINGGDNTKFDIGLTMVGMTNYLTNPIQPTRTPRVFPATTAIAVADLSVIATWIGIDVATGTVIQQASKFTATQLRTIAQLGAVISNGANLIAVNNLPSWMRAGINQLGDLLDAIGPMNLSGNVISANGANLNLNKSAGVEFKQGANAVTNPLDPHKITLAALTAFTFHYRLSNGTIFANTTAVDPNNYESPLGTLAAIPAANKFTIQRFSVFTSNLVRAQYGQYVYNTIAEAEAALSTEAFSTEANIAENGLLLCFLIVQDGATDLSDPSQAKFVPASKFGGPVGSGGTSITNTDGLPEGLVNLYFTDARAQTAVITSSITNGDTTHAPSGDAVFDALATKLPASSVGNGLKIVSNVLSVGESGAEDSSTFLRGDGILASSINNNYGTSNNLSAIGAAPYTAFLNSFIALNDNQGNSAVGLLMDSYGSSYGITGRRGNGTVASPSVVLSGDRLFSFTAGGVSNATGPVFTNTVSIGFFSSETYSSTATGAYITFDTTITGQTGRAERMRITGQANVAIGSTSDAHGGRGCLMLGNASTNPSANPSSGAVSYASGGGMYVRTAGGNIVNYAPNTAPSVTGSRGGNAALASLLTQLAGLGLITDSTTA